MNLDDMKNKLKRGEYIRWSFCTKEEKIELQKLGKIILHYGGVTTARLKQ